MERRAIDALLSEYRELVTDRSESAHGKHIVAMLDVMADIDDSVKLNRWLGFVQGALWVMNIRTIEQLRDETRGAVNEEFQL